MREGARSGAVFPATDWAGASSVEVCPQRIPCSVSRAVVAHEGFRSYERHMLARGSANVADMRQVGSVAHAGRGSRSVRRGTVGGVHGEKVFPSHGVVLDEFAPLLSMVVGVAELDQFMFQSRV